MKSGKVVMKYRFEKLIIDIKVRDLDRAIVFYRDTLKLPLIHKDSDWASFEAVGAEVHLYLYGGAEHGLEFRVSDIEGVVEELKARGVKFHIEQEQVNLVSISGDIMRFPWGKSAHFNDSEGNHIALVEDE